MDKDLECETGHFALCHKLNIVLLCDCVCACVLACMCVCVIRRVLLFSALKYDLFFAQFISSRSFLVHFIMLRIYCVCARLFLSFYSLINSLNT